MSQVDLLKQQAIKALGENLYNKVRKYEQGSDRLGI
jgi:hypothetical protein